MPGIRIFVCYFATGQQQRRTYKNPSQTTDGRNASGKEPFAKKVFDGTVPSLSGTGSSILRFNVAPSEKRITADVIVFCDKRAHSSK
jgi:hypothetical protein